MSSIMRARNGLMGRSEVSEVIGALSRAEGCWTFDASFAAFISRSPDTATAEVAQTWLQYTWERGPRRRRQSPLTRLPGAARAAVPREICALSAETIRHDRTHQHEYPSEWAGRPFRKSALIRSGRKS